LAIKAYADTKLSLTRIPLSGNITMTGTTKAIQATAPTTANSSVIKTTLTSNLSSLGETTTGDLNMKTKMKTNFGAPTCLKDAVP